MKQVDPLELFPYVQNNSPQARAVFAAAGAVLFWCCDDCGAIGLASAAVRRRHNASVRRVTPRSRLAS